MTRAAIRIVMALTAFLLVGAAYAQGDDCVAFGDYTHLDATVQTGARFLDRAGDLVYTSSLQIIDVSVPGAPDFAGSFPGQDGDVRGIQVAGGHLYVIYSAADGEGFNGLAVYDLADPNAPTLTGTLSMPQFMTQLRVIGERAYLRNDQGRLLIVDVSDPAFPEGLGSIGQTWLDSFDVRGDWLYAVDALANDVVAIDVSDPTTLSVGYRLPLTGIISITFNGDTGYFLHDGGGTDVLEFTGPDQYITAGSFPAITRPLVLRGTMAYAYGLPLAVYDVADAANPALVLEAPFVIHDGMLDGDRLLVGLSNAFAELAVGLEPGTPATTAVEVEATLAGMAAFGTDGLVTLSRMGLETWDASDCSAPALQGGFMWQGNVRGHAVSGDILFVLFQGSSFGNSVLAAYDLSDPANPAELGRKTFNFEMTGLVANAEYLYSSEFGSLIVIDAFDPADPVLLSKTDGAGFSPIAAIDGDVMLAAIDAEVTHFDVSDPGAPVAMSVIVVSDPALHIAMANDLAVVTHAGGARIYDVTDLGTKSLVGKVIVPGVVDGVAFDGTHLYLESNGVHVFDVSDPGAAFPMGSLGYEADRLAHLTLVGSCLYGDHYLTGDRGRIVIAPTACTDEPPVEGPVVVIDIKPGSDTNPINCRSHHGVIPVAILTTDDFDALTVDHNTVRFGPGEAMEVHVHRGRCDDDGDDDDDDGEGGDDKSRGGRNGRGGHDDRNGRGGHDDGDHRGGRDGHGDRGRGHGHGHGRGCDNPGHGHGRDCDGELQRHEEDVDGDGDIDLVLHFAKAEAMIACGDTEAFLTGETFAGESFTASDVVCTTGDCCRDDDDGEDDGEGGHEKELTGVAVKASLGLSPNPFNPQTTIAFALPEAGRVRVDVYDVTGRRIATVADESYGVGEHRVTWAGLDQGGRPVASGVYFVRLAGPGFTLQQRALLLK